MRVLFISGSWPPSVCGVGHYTSVLADHLEGSIEVMRYGCDVKFSKSNLLKILRDIRALKPDLIHLQYPTVGYRRSLVPSLLAVASGVPSVVTLHEYSLFRWYRAPWFFPFRFSDILIFTSARERNAFQRVFGRSEKKTRVIAIGSNIPRGHDAKRDMSISYFGLLMPNKGIEDFLKCTRLIQESETKRIIIGSVPEGFQDYAQQIIDESRSLGISLYLDKTDDEVADLLRRTKYAYLPFPDGASEKRGSLIAALANEVIVLTPHSALTPDWMRASTIDADSPQNAAKRLIELQGLIDGGSSLVDFAKAATQIDWDKISSEHLRLYQSIMPAESGGT